MSYYEDYEIVLNMFEALLEVAVAMGYNLLGQSVAFTGGANPNALAATTV